MPVATDGKIYTEDNASITPNSTVIFTVTGSNFEYPSDANALCYATGYEEYIDSDYWTIDTENNIAVSDVTKHIVIFAGCDGTEVLFTNNYRLGLIGSGIFSVSEINTFIPPEGNALRGFLYTGKDHFFLTKGRQYVIINIQIIPFGEVPEMIQCIRGNSGRAARDLLI